MSPLHVGSLGPVAGGQGFFCGIAGGEVLDGFSGHRPFLVARAQVEPVGALESLKGEPIAGFTGQLAAYGGHGSVCKEAGRDAIIGLFCCRTVNVCCRRTFGESGLVFD